MEWQPIETAPKDGGEIILGGQMCGVFAGFWSDIKNHWGRSGWYAESDRTLMHPDTTARPLPPTHWMPLPEPPHDP